MTVHQPRLIERNRKVVDLYAAGVALTDIAAATGIHPVAIPRVIKLAGVPVRNIRAKALIPYDKSHRRSVSRMEAAFGMPYAEYLALPLDVRRAYLGHRKTAEGRRIEWRFTFPEWYGVWQASGKFDQRGCRRGEYCMSRFGDVGAYEVGNVFIQLATANVSEAHRGKPSPKRSIPQAGTRGWTLRNYGGKDRYEVRLLGRHIGMFDTADQATAAYSAARGAFLK